MKITIVFPTDYFDRKKIDEQFAEEYKVVCSIPEFKTAFYNHDEYIESGVSALKIYPEVEEGVCILRTWMMKWEEYEALVTYLSTFRITVVNSVMEYQCMHLFPNIYPKIEADTPKMLAYDTKDKINAGEINATFRKFMIKDYVKSVKGFDFPIFFRTPLDEQELKENVEHFIKLRDTLFCGGIVFKEYVDLKKYGVTTNEYRVFYLLGQVLSVSRNSNQPDLCSVVPLAYVEKFTNLPSRYYTVDFGELSDGRFVILETGDGQVSGLSPNQDIFKYYDEMRLILQNSIMR